MTGESLVAIGAEVERWGCGLRVERVDAGVRGTVVARCIASDGSVVELRSDRWGSVFMIGAGGYGYVVTDARGWGRPFRAFGTLAASSEEAAWAEALAELARWDGAGVKLVDWAGRAVREASAASEDHFGAGASEG